MFSKSSLHTYSVKCYSPINTLIHLIELMHSITQYDPKCCSCISDELLNASISMNCIQQFKILGENASEN